MNRQIRPLARTVHGEKAQHAHVHAIDMMIHMPERFAGQFTGGVG